MNDEFKETNADEMTPEEIASKKKDAIDLLTERVNRGDHFLILTEGKDGDSALMIGGSVKELSRLISITMTKVEPLEEMVTLAVEAFKYARHADKIRGSSLGSTADEMMKEMGCENCHTKDDCDIREGLLKARDSSNPMESLNTLMGTSMGQNIKPKGDC